jgi:peptide/nickel transport system substrate-binding protein
VPKYGYDPAKARALLQEAGLASGFTLKAIVSELAGFRAPMTLLQEQWRRLNINLELQIVDHASFHRLIRQDKSEIIVYTFTRAPLADVVLSEFYHSNSIVGKPTAITNFIHYDRIDQLMDQARGAKDQKEQLRLYAQIQKQILDDAVVIPVMNSLWMIVTYPYVQMPEITGMANPSSLNYFVPITEKTYLK